MKRVIGCWIALAGMLACGDAPLQPRSDSPGPAFTESATTADPAGALAYVTVWTGPKFNPGPNGDRVSVIDVGTNEVETAVDVGRAPTAVALTPDNAIAYVANTDEDRVSVIDTRTKRIVTAIPVGSAPIALATTPDGESVYVVHSNSPGVHVIDTRTNEVVAVAQNPPARALAIRPDGVYAFAVSTNGVYFIRTLTNTLHSRVEIKAPVEKPAVPPLIPDGIAFSPDGSFAYVVNGTDHLIVIDANALSIAAVVPLESFTHGFPVAIAVSPDGRTLYVAELGSRSLAVIEAATYTSVASIPLASAPLGVAVTPDGSHVYVAAMDGVYAVETRTNEVVAAIDVGGMAFGVAIAPGATTPAEDIASLLDTVVALELNRGIEQALSGPLDAALASIEADRPAAVHQLQAFINQVKALQGRSLSDAEADALIAAAQTVIDAIGSS